MKRNAKQLAAKAVAALEAEWWKDATPSEAESVISLAYDSGIRLDNAILAGFVSEPKAAEVRQRIALRRKLNLPNLDCTARRRLFDARYVKTSGGYERAPDCTCLTTALTELGESATKGEVLARSSEHHRAWLKAYPRRPRKPKQEPSATAVAAVAEPPSEPPPSEPRPDLTRRPRVWRSREPAPPLSWAAFKAQEEGREWMTRQF